jgi:hypothetical protein
VELEVGPADAGPGGRPPAAGDGAAPGPGGHPARSLGSAATWARSTSALMIT